MHQVKRLVRMDKEGRNPATTTATQEAPVSGLASANTIVPADIHQALLILPSLVADSNPPLCLCLRPLPRSNHSSRRRVNVMCAVASLIAAFSLRRRPARQRRSSVVLATSLLSRLSHKRLKASFHVEAQRGEQDLYRCITLSPRGAAVSNFGELIIRGELD